MNSTCCKLAAVVFSVLVLFLLQGCKISENRVIQRNDLSQESDAIFELNVDGSESPSQTIAFDIAGTEEDVCETDVMNMGSGPLSISVRIPEKGWSVTGHFLEACDLTELVEQAWRNSLGQFAYGAQFGVRNEQLSLVPKDCLPRMREVSRAHHTPGYAFEKLWLHLFGIPFTKPPRVDLDGNPVTALKSVLS